MGIYVVDSNIFIQAHRVSYPLDVAFSFWNKFKQLAEEGKLISVDKVKNEIYDKNDALEEWCKVNLPEDFFKESSEVMAAYGQVSVWAISRSSHYMPNALNEFLDADEADAFIVAYALADPNVYNNFLQNLRTSTASPNPCVMYVFLPNTIFCVTLLFPTWILSVAVTCLSILIRLPRKKPLQPFTMH